MKMKKSLFLVTLFLVLAQARPVLANNPPGGGVILSEVLILPIMILLTVIGGGYGVLRQLRGKPLRFAGRIVGAILCILVSFCNEGYATLLAIIFGFISLARSAKMIAWGFKSLSRREIPDYLKKANPWRLIPAGTVLALVTVFLVGQALAFLDYWPPGEGPLERFVAFELAYSRLEESRTGQARFIRPSGEEDLYSFLFKNVFLYVPRYPGEPPSLEICSFHFWGTHGSLPPHVEFGKDDQSFTIYVRPLAKFPFFPYDYLTSQPSFRADETGKIRMVMTHSNATLCPPDAPVVTQVTEAEIKEMMTEIEQGAKNKK